MSPAELEAIRARVEAATPGPWGFERCDLTTLGMAETTYQHIRSGPIGVADTYHARPLAIEGFGPMSGYIKPRHGNAKDAEFIAAARTDVPALLAEVERLRGLIKAAEMNGCYPTEVRGNCPWCGYAPGNYKRSHAPECPAFNEDRSVR